MRKAVGFLSVCLGVGVLAPLATAGAAHAATTRTVHPGESIQAAVDASVPGDTVVVESGTYAQSVGIHTSGITLIGRGATLVPPADDQGFDCRAGGEVADGICITAPDGGTQAADGPPMLDGVTVRGMTVKGFPDSGIFAFGSTNLTYDRNTAINNGGYGLAAFTTVGTRMTHNTAVGSHEANFYLGDSPGANGLIRSNVAHRGGWGIFIRNSEGVTVQGNDMRQNCVGLLVLADAPGPAGNVTARHNTILDNRAACPAGEGPPVSGVGVALIGAHDVKVQGNVISGNVPGGPTAFQGGVVLAQLSPDGTAPMNNLISKNAIQQNSPDVLSDGSGSGNVIKSNKCGADPGACA
jgi:parallel beta-helix repeat protein